MTDKMYPVGNLLTDKQAESLLAKLIYSIEGVTDCRFDAVNQEIQIRLAPECNEADIERTVARMIDNEKKQRIIGHRIYKENSVLPSMLYTEETRARVDRLFAEDGQVRRDWVVKLYDKLDGLFEGMALKHQANLRKYPSMISMQALEKCQYIQSFPQNIHLISEIPHQLDVLERVKEAASLEEIVRISPFALAPAVCFHCYEELAGNSIEAPFVLTARGNCFRHEAPWRIGKHRMNEFSMREIVLFGDSDYVESIRRECMEEVWSLFETLGLAGKIVTASDLFYFSEDSSKGQHQLMGNMKYELIVRVYDGSEFSIASFNNMGDTLCKQFNIRHANHEMMKSGCVAFGIDRWVYALLATHGPDYSRWPEHVRNILQ